MATAFLALLPVSAGVAISCVVGLAVGHSVDLLFDRLYTGQAFAGPITRCSTCQSSARPAHLVPLAGLLAWRGRCPDCGDRLPARALFLPLGAEALFVTSYFAMGGLVPGLAGGLFATIFLALTFTDLDRRLLPNRVVYSSTILAIALSWVWPDTSMVDVLLGGGVAIAVALLLLILSLPFGAGSFGMGDVKMIVLMGFVLGVPAFFAGVFIGIFAGGAVAAFLLITHLRGRKDYIPHGPFLALGAVIALFWGQQIYDWYAFH
jgi:leader peptidase (prepilin peptidase)/N-methyltransferase